MLSLRVTGQRCLATKRFFSTPSASVVESLDHWISVPKRQDFYDTLHPERLQDLYVTLPTRDGTRKPYTAPKVSAPLGYGHHFAYLYARLPESRLRADGTDGDFCVPEPLGFSRRMWASGKMTWNNDNPLLIGSKATATWSVTPESVQKKGFEKGKPMIFVNKHISISMDGNPSPSVVEDRMHVYLPVPSEKTSAKKRQYDVPDTHDFSFSYMPTMITLFRFSALTFNAHHIHLDKEYTVQKEGYEERLVHGPLTSLMMLEAVVFNRPDIKLKTYTYLATSPLVLGHGHTIYGKDMGSNVIKLWCKADNGILGMMGEVEYI